jgi:hypothetical protein
MFSMANQEFRRALLAKQVGTQKSLTRFLEIHVSSGGGGRGNNAVRGKSQQGSYHRVYRVLARSAFLYFAQ